MDSMSKLVSVADLQQGDRFEFVAIGDKFAGSPVSDHPNLMVVANVPKTNRIANSCFFRYKSEDDPLEVRSWNGAAEIEVRLFTDRVVSPTNFASSTPPIAAVGKTPTPVPAPTAPAPNGLAAAMAALKSVFPEAPSEVKSILKADAISATKVDMRPSVKPAPTIVGPVDDEDEDEAEETSGKLSLRIPVKGELHDEADDDTDDEADDEPAADEIEADAESTKPTRKRTVAKSAKKESAKSAAPKKKSAKSAEMKSAAPKPAKKKAAKPAAKKKS